MLALRQRQREDRPALWRPDQANKLLGRSLPAFALPGLKGQPGLASTDVVAAGQAILLNFFASWCWPCQQEAPALLRLSRQGLPIWGIAYQDKPDDTVAFLRQHGDPYRRIACDLNGAAGSACGIVGVPESFLVDRSGIVRWHWAGGLSEDVVRLYIDPLLRAGV